MARTISQPASKAPSSQRVTRSGPSGRRMPAPHITAEAIAQRAYKKFLAGGCRHGNDQQDWFEAEQELQAEIGKK